MEKCHLHDNLVEYLTELPMKKSDLVSFLSDILCIEKESVYRRLNKKVMFTLQEFEIIIRKFNVSTDRFMNNKQGFTPFSYNMLEPLSVSSMDELTNEMMYIEDKLKVIDENPVSLGEVFDCIPVEFFSPFEHLTKFMYFKWGYCFIENKFFTTYSEWKVPEQIIRSQNIIMDYNMNFKDALYVWDRSIITNLVNEIKFLNRIHILQKDDVMLILEDLHNLLDRLEDNSKGANFQNNKSGSIDIYISNNYIGGTNAYFQTEKNNYTFHKTLYMQTLMYQNEETFNRIYIWVNSMKKVSTLISGTGEIERRIFFDEQHKILDNIVIQ